MDISVVIPSYNTEGTISETLLALSAQKHNCSFEIIVADCSEHNRVATIVGKFQNTIYIHEPTRFNPGEGRNIGSKLASGRLLIFIDSDIKLDIHAIENAWDFYKEGHRIFGGALELNLEHSRGLASYLEHYFFNHQSQAGRPMCSRQNLSSALMCIDRDTFVESGGFKDIPRMQDTELTERLKANGQELYFSPRVVAQQTQDSPLNSVLRKIYINGQNLYYIRYKPSINLSRKCIFFIMLPYIGIAKSVRIIYRHLKYQSWPNKFRTLVLSVPIVLATVFWVAGFYNAMITEKGIGKNR